MPGSCHIPSRPVGPVGHGGIGSAAPALPWLCDTCPGLISAQRRFDSSPRYLSPPYSPAPVRPSTASFLHSSVRQPPPPSVHYITTAQTYHHFSAIYEEEFRFAAPRCWRHSDLGLGSPCIYHFLPGISYPPSPPRASNSLLFFHISALYLVWMDYGNPSFPQAPIHVPFLSPSFLSPFQPSSGKPSSKQASSVSPPLPSVVMIPPYCQPFGYVVQPPSATATGHPLQWLLPYNSIISDSPASPALPCGLGPLLLTNGTAGVVGRPHIWCLPT